MTAHTLNCLGLVANMLGVILAFFFGFPQPDHSEDVGIALFPGTPLQDGRTVEQRAADQRKRKRCYRWSSLSALGLMFVGFGAQAIALWVG